ncbi:Uncharacterised protein [Mycobacteroides abscessus subsp. abscessus]|nr:Uncharacterised protein [Mycobacteroides abscessus subsp. abscessus]
MRNSSFIAALTVSAVTAVISAPPGHASTDCSQEGIAQAVQATNSALGIYFDKQDRELKDIMAPLDDKKRECRTV